MYELRIYFTTCNLLHMSIGYLKPLVLVILFLVSVFSYLFIYLFIYLFSHLLLFLLKFAMKMFILVEILELTKAHFQAQATLQRPIQIRSVVCG